MKKKKLLQYGDNMNDKLMIQNAGIGIAMGQSTPRIKEIAEKKEDIKAAQQKAEQERKQKEEERKKNNPELQRGKHTEIVDAGIKLLERLFPDAGFSRLDSMPDLYPYFQPIYEFRDGYNLLSPQNPMQVVVTLLRIIEDLLQGCRNIVFTEEDDGSQFNSNKRTDKLSVALNEWTVYREELFEKKTARSGHPLLYMHLHFLHSRTPHRKALWSYGKHRLSDRLYPLKYPHVVYRGNHFVLPCFLSDLPLCKKTENGIFTHDCFPYTFYHRKPAVMPWQILVSG